jgi:hypothetical protein
LPKDHESIHKPHQKVAEWWSSATQLLSVPAVVESESMDPKKSSNRKRQRAYNWHYFHLRRNMGDQLNGAVQQTIALQHKLDDACKQAEKYRNDIKKLKRQLKNKEEQMKQLRQEKEYIYGDIGRSTMDYSAKLLFITITVRKINKGSRT